MKVVYWNNIPSPYMVDRFNAIADRGNIEFEAWFSDRTESDRSWCVDETAWRFPARYLGTGSRAAIRGVDLVRRTRPDLLLCLYERAEYVATALFARAIGVKVAMHALKTFDT